MPEQIIISLKSFSHGNLTEKALNLFQTLGYKIDRQQHLANKSFQDFAEFIHDEANFSKEKAFTDDWRYVDLLFQLTGEDLSDEISMFDTSRVDDTIIESYLFFALELDDAKHFTRTNLANITREINKCFSMPVFVLFKIGQNLTLSVINRRLHKRDETKDVVEIKKVSLIKDIDYKNPKRSHLEILQDLSLGELQKKHKFQNFVELHQAWMATLDTKELNKRFFRELSNWYFWAVSRVKFPKTPNDTDSEETHSAKSVIRLITRLMFVWFLKEKGLISAEIFSLRELKGILHNFDEPKMQKPARSKGENDGDEEHTYSVRVSANESAFYKAILQNLFFATLNTDDRETPRRFISESFQGKNSQHGTIHNVFRYKDFFKNPEETLETYFRPIPFLNGGLFECLDTRDAETGDLIRIDGFSQHPKNPLFVPDELFFGEPCEVDLNEVYGTKNKKYEVRGLLRILDNYKFTIAENTPIEEEIALDPELLGKVFENLLANYNPETKTTARKQTGSFYTPREIVNYMVDESLIAYLKTKLQTETQGFMGFVAFGENQPTMFGNEMRVQQKFEIPASENRWLGKEEDLEKALRSLFSYDETENQFNEIETEILIKAINDCKILDPACGSGAFPMGILQRLVFLLGKLDPNNVKWRELQRQVAVNETDEAFKNNDVKERENRLLEINEVFENNASDYGRKLFLIENCIYGVDIQPIAIQISKLRFFISLIIDQKIDAEKPNRGVRPLPNLETKLIAANTLIGLDAQRMLKPSEVNELENKLKQVRHEIFRARTTATKNNRRKRDKQIRREIADLLKQTGFAPDAADKIADWSPDNQDAHADWFDPEWMFGIEKGFDIVIGNPPYLRVQGLQQTQPEMIPIYRENYKSAQGSFDIYGLFIESGYSLLNDKGQFSYIVPHKFFQATFGKGLRELLGRKKALRQIVRFGAEQVFDEATTYTCLLFLSKQIQDNFDLIEVFKIGENENIFETVSKNKTSETYQRELLPAPKTDDWDFQIGDKNSLLKKLQKQNTKLGDITRKIFQGIATSADKIFVLRILQEKEKTIICYSKQTESEVEIEKDLVKPFLMGKDVHRYELPEAKNVVIFPYHIKEEKAELMSQRFIQNNFPKGWNYLLENQSTLAERENGRFEKDWHCFSRPQNLTEFASPKIMTPEIALGCQMTFDLQGTLYHTTKVYSFVFKENCNENPRYLLGLLNSKVLWFFLSSTGYVLRGGYYTFKTDYLKPFPIPKATEAQQTEIAEIVDKILTLKKADNRADTTELEREIDGLVYGLYDLTNEEIAIVEGVGKVKS